MLVDDTDGIHEFRPEGRARIFINMCINLHTFAGRGAFLVFNVPQKLLQTLNCLET